MGLLSEGTPLSWEEMQDHIDTVREHAVTQFVNLYKEYSDTRTVNFLWGDEVEYMIISVDQDGQKARFSLTATEKLQKLQNAELDNPTTRQSTWSPEYGSYMLESSPYMPYGDLMEFVSVVESNMKLRKRELSRVLEENEYALTLTTFPRNGCPDSTDPPAVPTPYEGLSRSLFVPDEAIQQAVHQRYRVVTDNLRKRRGEKVTINIPVFKDTGTRTPFLEDLTARGATDKDQKLTSPNHIYMDCIGLGAAGCCIQATFQASCLEEAKELHDQLVPLAPVMIALSAATPIYRGYLSDLDTRHEAMSQSLDSRTKEERGLKPLRKKNLVIGKSNCDSTDCYLTCEDYDDVRVVYDTDIYNKLRKEGVDGQMAKYMAHMFIRDPFIILKEDLDHFNAKKTDHLESILTASWPLVKLKMPSETAGWRVEFRPMEAQLTDSENAAYVVFVALLVRTIISLRLNFLMPISKVDVNLKRSYKRDAVTESTFCFRKCVTREKSKSSPPTQTIPCTQGLFCHDDDSNDESVYEDMSIDGIINGKVDFPGLIPLINCYVDQQKPDSDTRANIDRYLRLISLRASGQETTTARWMRDFVTSHPDYKHDSVVSERINYDLMMACARKSAEDVNTDCT